MPATDECQKLTTGSKSVETVELIFCPNCGERANKASKYGDINACIACDEPLGRDLPLEEERLPVFTCGACGEETPPFYERLGHVGDVQVLNCSNKDCNYLVAAIYDNDEYRELNDFLSATWIEGVDNFTRDRQVTDVETPEQKVGVQLLNIEAKNEDTTFSLYKPEQTNAFLAYHDQTAVGYLTWTAEPAEDTRSGKVAVLRQIFTLPTFRRAGVGTLLLKRFKQEAANFADGLYAVEGANTQTLRLLKAAGDVDYRVIEESVEPTKTDTVVFLKSNPFQKLASELAREKQ
ncbi:GNAT family N-acetyltransferase [Halorubrum ezzemoulense]|uniref:GNAT family N-acetyltransferase n=1 Tax=Halorubrum ezzemoulense TaxID=337243 RepID=UPI00232C808E|nr:GNAT family N-acetyltransferase [Halorubrum ezzemoulense]MDB2269502.1 GNAT family N-acetyltransferase [Halorubrum ezzemoulense]